VFIGTQFLCGVRWWHCREGLTRDVVLSYERKNGPFHEISTRRELRTALLIEPSSVCAPGCQSMTSQTGEDRPYRGFLADLRMSSRGYVLFCRRGRRKEHSMRIVCIIRFSLITATENLFQRTVRTQNLKLVAFAHLISRTIIRMGRRKYCRVADFDILQPDKDNDC
jgi:hypothetical protein